VISKYMARRKRARKNVPLLIGNLGPLTFGLDDNEGRAVRGIEYHAPAACR